MRQILVPKALLLLDPLFMGSFGLWITLWINAPGAPAAPDPWRLGLLPSGPDPVHARTVALDRGLG